MNILCIGDVVGSAGCRALQKALPTLKKIKKIDAVIVNGENSADGNGILPSSAENILSCGTDLITTGNHVFRRREIYDFLDESSFVIRPANYPKSAPGRGISYIDMGFSKIAVINLIGTVYMESNACPFETADEMIKEAERNDAKIIMIDFHAEATAEKKALAFYLDGRVSAVFGTHTHTQTADEQILPGGTGFISDLGMTGPYLSVLGVKPELAISKMKDKLPVRFMPADGENILNGCIFGIDKSSGKCERVERIGLIGPQ